MCFKGIFNFEKKIPKHVVIIYVFGLGKMLMLKILEFILIVNKKLNYGILFCVFHLLTRMKRFQQIAFYLIRMDFNTFKFFSFFKLHMNIIFFNLR